MQSSSEMEKRLQRLIQRFNSLNSQDNEESSEVIQDLCTLSVIELGGWIEQYRDYIFQAIADEMPATAKQREDLLKEMHSDGFSYDKHFAKSLQKAIGKWGLLFVEQSLDQRSFLLFKSSLGNTWTARCKCAHNPSDSNDSLRFSPSWVLNEFRQIDSGLKSYEQAVTDYCHLLNSANRPIREKS